MACPAVAQTASYKLGDLLIKRRGRATPAGAKVGGAYLKITNNGTQPDRLVGGSLTGAREVEVHEMSMANNVMKMRHLKDGLEIKPGQTVELKPGGYHLMLTGLSDRLKQGQKVKGSLTFEKGRHRRGRIHGRPGRRRLRRAHALGPTTTGRSAQGAGSRYGLKVGRATGRLGQGGAETLRQVGDEIGWVLQADVQPHQRTAVPAGNDGIGSARLS